MLAELLGRRCAIAAMLHRPPGLPTVEHASTSGTPFAFDNRPQSCRITPLRSHGSEV